MPDDTIRVAEAARILEISKGTVNKMIRSGQLRAYKLNAGNSPYRLSESEVREYLRAAQEKGAKP